MRGQIWVRLVGHPAVVAVGVALLFSGSTAVAATREISAAPGSVWTGQSTPNPAGTTASVLDSVSCASVRSCVAVGGYYPSGGTAQTLAFAEGWNGRDWVLQHIPDPPGTQASWLTGVSCPVVTVCVAVGYIIDRLGYVSLAERWNGRIWTRQPTPNPTAAQVSVLSQASCSSPRVCLAVGDFVNQAGHSFTLAERWSGRSWAIQRTPNPGTDDELGGVSCSRATACTAVGDYYSRALVQVTLAERWNGSSWATQRTPNPPLPPSLTGNAPSLDAVSCPSTSACTAIGSFYQGSGDVTLAERWNGRSWAIQRTSDPAADNYPGGISCASASDCIRVGMYFTTHFFTYAEAWDGRRWAFQKTPNPGGATDSGLYDVSCPSPTVCTAVGNFIDAAGSHLTLAERYA